MQQVEEDIFYDVAHNSSGVKILTSDLYNIYNQKPMGLVVIKNDKIRSEIINLFKNAFEDLIISTIPSKDILSKEDIKAQIPIVEAEIETAKQDKINLKASAKAKLIAGEPLTEAEADTLVI